MRFTEEHAAKALKALGIDFAQEDFTLAALVDGMNAELRHGRKARGTNLTNDDPTMTAMLAVNNLRVSPSYYSGRVGKSAWERSLSRGVKHRGSKTELKTIDFELEDIDTESGVFSGYGAVFSNIDSGGDIIEPGAFTKTIAEGVGRVKILSGHNVLVYVSLLSIAAVYFLLNKLILIYYTLNNFRHILKGKYLNFRYSYYNI